MRESRRRFLSWAALTIGTACIGCRDQDHRDDSSNQTTPAQTNSAAVWPDNVPGRFWVTQACIDCDLCRETAPAIFARNEKDGHAYVSRQPGSDSDLRACLEALEGCPVEAIIDTEKSR